MTTRGIRRKKSTLTELKIAVVGAPGVGKSGMYSSQTKKTKHHASQVQIPHVNVDERT